MHIPGAEEDDSRALLYHGSDLIALAHLTRHGRLEKLAMSSA